MRIPITATPGDGDSRLITTCQLLPNSWVPTEEQEGPARIPPVLLLGNSSYGTGFVFAWDTACVSP